MSIKPKSLEKRKRERREVYLLAARTIFSEKGFNDARVRDITERAETSVGNFYRYFESKDQIFEDLITQFFDLFMHAVLDLDKYDLPPLEEVRKTFRKVVRIFRENSKIALVFIEQMSGINEKFAKMKREYVDLFCKTVGRIIQKYADKDLIPEQNPELSAHQWVGAFLEGFRWWIRDENSMTETEFTHNVTDFILRGIIEDFSRVP